MPQYEYELIVLCDPAGTEGEKKITTGDMEKMMTQLGKQGFRFVGLRQGVRSNSSFHYPLAVMERTIDKAAEVDDPDLRAANDDAPIAERPAYEWDEWEKKKRT